VRPISNIIYRREIGTHCSLHAWRPGRRHRRERGFTYIGVLILIAIMGVALASTGEIWHTVRKREKEQELLYVGDQFRRAIKQFYRHSPPQARRYPLSLEELLKDPRYPGIQRYIRKIYPDPMTGNTDWGLITGQDEQIYGIYSLSDEEPFKKKNFKPADKKFEDKMKYSEWVFI
jgi:type II secretory pathway pseudopilin PulG